MPPHRTKRLTNRMANKVQYHEINTGHDLFDPESGAWIQVKGFLEVFAEAIRQQTGENGLAGIE